MNKHNNSGKKSELTSKRAKPRGPMRRDTKEVLTELVGKLKEKLDPKKPAATSAGEKHKRGELRPNLDRLTVGVDLGDRWSNYCILGLEGETLAEGQLRTTQEDLAEFFQALNAARVVFEVGTHSPWVQEVIGGCGHEVLVANPRMMDGSKRRKRKNDRIDANKLARLGRVDPQSLHPIQHRSREVRQDLVILRARDALVAARTELINATRGLVKSMGTRLPKCSSPSFAEKVEGTVPAELRDALLPLMRMATALSDCIQEYDEKIEKLGREKYGHTELLRQVKGGADHGAGLRIDPGESGPIREESRCGAISGLVPKQEDSGESQPQLGISKTGDTMLRKLLVGSAHYILGRSNQTRTYDGMGCDSASGVGRMRRRSSGSGGAEARRLTALPLGEWRVYEPLRQGTSATIAPAVAA